MSRERELRILHPKLPGELRRQTQRSSRLIGTDIVPPSYGERVFGMPLERLERAFPVRAEIYDRTFHPRHEQEVSPLTTNRMNVMNGLDRSIMAYHQADDPYLRSIQEEAIENLSDMMERGTVVDRGHFDEATGFGKTTVYTEIVKSAKVKTLVVVPTKIAGYRAYEELTRGDNPADVGRVFDGIKERDREVEITTHQSLLGSIARGEVNPEDYGLVIFDEAHKALSEKRVATMNTFTNTVKLAFTGSPKYTEEKQVGDEYGPLVQRVTIKEATRMGNLCPHTNYEANTSADLSSVRVRADGDYDEAELATAINIDTRNKAVVSIYQRKKFAGKPALAFCSGVEHARRMAETFQETGIAAEVIHGEQSEIVRRDILLRLKNGTTKVVCNADLLVESLDYSELEVILNARPTLSVPMATQRAGRGLRNDPENPDKHAYIIDFIDRDARRDHEPIRFADVIEERAFGIIVDIQGGDTPRRRLPVYVDGIEVYVHMQELISVFDDLVRDDTTRTQISITTETLVALLGKHPDTIRRHMKNYFRGSPKSIESTIAPVREKLKQFPDSGDEAVELPAIVVERMLIDGMYQQLYGQEILRDIPGLVQELTSTLEDAQPFLPALKIDNVGILTGHAAQARRISSTADAARLIGDFSSELDTLNKKLQGPRVKAADAQSMAANEALSAAELVIELYKHDEVRTARNISIGKLVKEQPDMVVNFILNRENVERTELFGAMRHLADREQVAHLINITASRYSMERGLEANLVVALSQITVDPESLPDRGSLREFGGQLFELNQTFDGMSDFRIGENSVDFYVQTRQGMRRMLGQVTEILDAHDAPLRSSDRLARSEVNLLRKLRTDLRINLNNTRLIRRDVARALGNDPQIITEFNQAHESGERMYESTLVRTIYDNYAVVT